MHLYLEMGSDRSGKKKKSTQGAQINPISLFQTYMWKTFIICIFADFLLAELKFVIDRYMRKNII